jgi:hypothetical protein
MKIRGWKRFIFYSKSPKSRIFFPNGKYLENKSKFWIFLKWKNILPFWMLASQSIVEKIVHLTLFRFPAAILYTFVTMSRIFKYLATKIRHLGLHCHSGLFKNSSSMVSLHSKEESRRSVWKIFFQRLHNIFAILESLLFYFEISSKVLIFF